MTRLRIPCVTLEPLWHRAKKDKNVQPLSPHLSHGPLGPNHQRIYSTYNQRTMHPSVKCDSSSIG